MTAQYVELIFDLRAFSETVDSISGIDSLWREINSSLVDRPLKTGGLVSLNLPAGNIDLWVANANGNAQVTEKTEFLIVDVLRNPKLLYQCATCGAYGPLRCIRCEEEGRETRLCSKHAHIIKDELSAYCSEHIPTCNCRDGCRETATFRCRSCARTNRQRSLYGQHYHRKHPKDPDIDYCIRCYEWKFERCQSPGCNRIGKSKCQYQTRDMEQSCNAPACTDHSYQWKIWGPHNRGVTLCERHKNVFSMTSPEDLIFLIITAKPPFARRGRYHFMPNPFRLRRLINRHRTNQLSFSQLETALRSIEQNVPYWGKSAERNYGSIMKSYTETMGNLDSLERDFFDKVRNFYQNRVGWEIAAQIKGVEIQDRYSKPGRPPTYRVHFKADEPKGRLVKNRGVNILNELRTLLNIDVDLD